MVKGADLSFFQRHPEVEIEDMGILIEEINKTRLESYEPANGRRGADEYVPRAGDYFQIVVMNQGVLYDRRYFREKISVK